MVNEKQKSSSQPGQLETTFKSDFDDLNIISYNDNNNFFVDCQDSFSDDLFIKNIYNEKKQNNVFLFMKIAREGVYYDKTPECPSAKLYFFTNFIFYFYFYFVYFYLLHFYFNVI